MRSPTDGVLTRQLLLLAAAACALTGGCGAFVLPSASPPRRFSAPPRTTAPHRGFSRPQRLLPPLSMTISESHAAELFRLADADGSGNIDLLELEDLLLSMDLRATREEARALFRALDTDGDGEIVLEEFMSWYSASVEDAADHSESVRKVILNRRSVADFDAESEVEDLYLLRAVEAATAAPCRNMREPWRFVGLGPEGVAAVSKLLNAEGAWGTGGLPARRAVSNWCLATARTDSDGGYGAAEEDYAATCFAVQNFMLSMWADGVGTRWNTHPVFDGEDFSEICGIDTSVERVVGVIWYGLASGGLEGEKPRRNKGVEEVLSFLP